ncbi:MAG TPA: AsmA family protein [Gammaproteobacteria bacterium]|nr:AsmA family protein [Gammaproteobacteria bacterium]
MSRLIRGIALLAIMLVTLLAAAVVVLPMVIDPNDYRDEIAAAVESATGRKLDIEGDLSLSVFPWLGIGMGETRLANAAGFPKRPFARVRQVQVRVRLLPLLSRKLEMDTVVLKGLDIVLETDPSGRTNWQDLVATGADTEKASASPDAGGGAPALAGLAIGGIEIEDARILWDDRKRGQRYELSRLNLHAGAIGGAEAVPVTLSMHIAGTGLPAGGLEPGLSFRIALDPEVGSVDITRLELTLADLGLSGSLAGRRLFDAPMFSGRLEIAEFVPRDLMQALGVAVPATSDPLVLGRADAGMAFEASGTRLALNGLRLRLDDSTLEGSLSVANFARPALRFDLKLDGIDLDRYLPPQAAAPSAPATPTTAATAASGLIPVETLRALDLKGGLAIGTLKAARLRSHDIEMQVTAKDGLLRVHPATAGLYEGRYQGDVRIDVRGSLPVVSLDEKLTGVQAGPLLADISGERRLLGTADASAKLTTRGQSVEAFKRNLNGSLRFSFSDGAVKGVNLVRMIRAAKAVFKGKPLPPTDAPEQTDFSMLRGSATVTDGVVRNDDLEAKTPLLRVAGKGRVSLPDETIHYTLTLKIVGSLEGQGGRELQDLAGVPIPVQVRGSFAAPDFRVRLDEVLKGKAEKEIREKVEKKIRKKVEKKLEKKLGDKLQKLFR